MSFLGRFAAVATVSGPEHGSTPGTVLSAPTCSPTSWVRVSVYWGCRHFTDQAAEAQRDKVSCPESQDESHSNTAASFQSMFSEPQAIALSPAPGSGEDRQGRGSSFTDLKGLLLSYVLQTCFTHFFHFSLVRSGVCSDLQNFKYVYPLWFLPLQPCFERPSPFQD